MEKLGTTTFYDANDAAYTFDVYPLDAAFHDGGAVYVVAQRHEDENGAFEYDPVYIGQTSDLSNHFGEHPRQACFEEHNAATVCVFADPERATRQEIETALLNRYDAPCNDVASQENE